MKKPEYPFVIESLKIGSSGDISVGIFPEHYEAQVYIEVHNDAEIEEWRKKFEALYQEFSEGAKCAFDFEIKEWREQQEEASYEERDHLQGLPTTYPDYPER